MTNIFFHDYICKNILYFVWDKNTEKHLYT